jgi:zinc protease
MSSTRRVNIYFREIALSVSTVQQKVPHMNDQNFSLPRLDVKTLPGPETILRRELPNGITLLARENFSSPSVVLSGYLSVGAMQETPEQAGLANLTALGLMRGTQEHSFQEIFESLESIGARLSVGAGTHTTGFQGKALVEDLSLLLELLAEVLRKPQFPKPLIERLRAEQLTGLAIRDQNTGARAQMAFDELTYPSHPYALPATGFRETVETLSGGDLRRFHKKHYGPQGMVMVVVGAIETEAVSEAVETIFGDWVNANQVDQPALPPVAQPSGLLRKDIHLAGKTQCDIILGAPGPSRLYADYLAAALGNNILGRFGLFGRIGDAVRESAGLAYYSYSSLTGGPGPGPWQVNAGVNPVNVEKAIDLIRREIKRFVTKQVTEHELLENQAHFIGRLPLRLESNEGVAASLLHIERYDLGLDYYQRYPELIAAVTRKQVLRAAKEFLDPDHLAIATAGPVGKGVEV